MNEKRRIPLFPLHAVLCPGAALPLHIFEERYRLMLTRCIDQAEPFGVVLITEGRETGPLQGSVAEVGTTAVIREAKRYPDGRYDIMAVGGTRFRVELLRPDEQPYLEADVAILDEPIGDPRAARRLAGQVSDRFLRYLELLGPMLDEDDAPEIEIEIEIEETDAIEQGPEAGRIEPIELESDQERRELLLAAARRVASPEDPTALSYVLAGLVEVELPSRQRLLEASDTHARLDQLDALLVREIRLLERKLRPMSFDRRLDAARRN